MPPLPRATRSERGVGGQRRRRRRSSVASQRVTSIVEVVAGLGGRAALAGVDRQRRRSRGRAGHPSVPVDGLRVEPALDAGRQRAGAVGVERDVGDRLRAGVADERAVVPAQARRPASRARRPRAAAPWRGSSPSRSAIAAGVPPDGLVLKPWPVPKRFSSAGHDLDVERRHAELVGDELRRSAPSLPSASVVRLSTILPGRVDAQEHRAVRLVSHAGSSRRSCSRRAALLVGGQRVVVLAVAERRLRAAGRVRRHRGALAAGVDAGLHRSIPGRPSAARAVAARHRDRAARRPASRSPTAPRLGLRRRRPRCAPRSAAIASATSSSASRLWPLTSASTCGSAAAIPPARGDEPGARSRAG